MYFEIWKNVKEKTNKKNIKVLLRFSVATLFWFVAHFAHGRIEVGFSPTVGF